MGVCWIVEMTLPTLIWSVESHGVGWVVLGPLSRFCGCSQPLFATSNRCIASIPRSSNYATCLPFGWFYTLVGRSRYSNKCLTSSNKKGHLHSFLRAVRPPERPVYWWVGGSSGHSQTRPVWDWHRTANQLTPFQPPLAVSRQSYGSPMCVWDLDSFRLSSRTMALWSMQEYVCRNGWSRH